jgi:hypothetical protein
MNKKIINSSDDLETSDEIEIKCILIDGAHLRGGLHLKREKNNNLHIRD